MPLLLPQDLTAQTLYSTLDSSKIRSLFFFSLTALAAHFKRRVDQVGLDDGQSTLSRATLPSRLDHILLLPHRSALCTNQCKDSCLHP